MSILWRNVAKVGHRVLLVLDNSPGDEAGLTPFLDVITHIEGVQVNDGEKNLVALLGKRVDLPTDMTVYNIKAKASRKTTITPHRRWGGPGVLGIVARFDAVDTTDKRFHITEVAPGGPAEAAGLWEGADYLLGTDQFTLRTAEDVRMLLAAGHPLSALTAASATAAAVGGRSLTGTPAAQSRVDAAGCAGEDAGAEYNPFADTSPRARGATAAAPTHPAQDAAASAAEPGPTAALATEPSDGSPPPATGGTAAGASALRATAAGAPDGASVGAGSSRSVGSTGSEQGGLQQCAPTISLAPLAPVPLLLLYVYHAQTDTVRTVALEPAAVPVPAPPPRSPTVASAARAAALAGNGETAEAPPLASSAAPLGAGAGAAPSAAVSPTAASAAAAEGRPAAAAEAAADAALANACPETGSAAAGTAAPAAALVHADNAAARPAATEGDTLTCGSSGGAKGGPTARLSAWGSTIFGGRKKGSVDAPAPAAAAGAGGVTAEGSTAASTAVTAPAVPSPAPAHGPSAAPARGVIGGVISGARAAALSVSAQLREVGRSVEGSASVRAASAVASSVGSSISSGAAAAGSSVKRAGAAVLASTASLGASGEAVAQLPAGTWHEWAGMRVAAVPALPHASTLGRRLSAPAVLATQECAALREAEAAASERMARLGCSDLFGRFTGIPLAAAAAAQAEAVASGYSGAAVAAAVGVPVDRSGDSGKLAAAARPRNTRDHTLAHAHALQAYSRGVAVPARPGRSSLPSSPAASSRGGEGAPAGASLAADDTEASSAAAGRGDEAASASHPAAAAAQDRVAPAPPPRRTRGSMKRASLAASKAQARQMGIYVGGREGAEGEEEDVPEDESEQRRGDTGASSPASDAAGSSAGAADEEAALGEAATPKAAARSAAGGAASPSASGGRSPAASTGAGATSSATSSATSTPSRPSRASLSWLPGLGGGHAASARGIFKAPSGLGREQQEVVRERQERERLAACADMPLWEVSKAAVPGDAAPAPAAAGRPSAGIASSLASLVPGRRSSLTGAKEGSGAAMGGGKGLPSRPPVPTGGGAAIPALRKEASSATGLQAEGRFVVGNPMVL